MTEIDMTFETREELIRRNSLEEGIEEGIDQSRVESIKNIMETLEFTAEQAMNALKIPKGEQAKYMARL